MDYTKLRASDWLDLSRLTSAAVDTNGEEIQLTYFKGRFPDNTSGFLYYRTIPGGSPFNGEVRFRITTSQDPNSFAAGHDLEFNKIPWRRTLANIALHKEASGLQSLLVADDIIAPDLLSSFKQMLLADETTQPGNHAAEYLSALGQTFLVRFHRPTADLFAVGNDLVQRVSSYDLDAFVDFEQPVAKSGKRSRPWLGAFWHLLLLTLVSC